MSEKAKAVADHIDDLCELMVPGEVPYGSLAVVVNDRDEAMRREGAERWLSDLELDGSEPGFWGRAVARLLKRQRDMVTRDEAEHLMTVARYDTSRGVLGILDECLQSRQSPETRGGEG